MKPPLCFLLALVIITSYAQPGSLDLSFGNNGQATNQEAGYCNALAVQDDKKIIAGGKAYFSDSNGDQSGFSMIRFRPNGGIDHSFGNNGIVYTPNQNSITSLVALPNNKILVGGNSNPVLGRYLNNGKVDSSFGINGFIHHQFPSYPYIYFNDMKVQPNGRILIAGSAAGNFTRYYIMVARFLASGRPDSSFGNNGYAIHEAGVDCEAIALQPDGKIIVGGTSSSYKKFVTIRFNANGTADSSFGTYGVAITDLTGGVNQDYITSLAVQDDGKIIAVGSCDNVFFKLGMVRYLPNGTRDSSFGNKGIVLLSYNRAYAPPKAVMIQTDNKILVTGHYYTLTTPSTLAAWRFNTNGMLDSSFGVNGMAAPESVTDIQISTHGILQLNNKLLVLGRKVDTKNGGFNDSAIVVRFNVGSIPAFASAAGNNSKQRHSTGTQHPGLFFPGASTALRYDEAQKEIINKEQRNKE